MPSIFCLSLIDCNLAFSLLNHWLIDLSLRPSTIKDAPLVSTQVAKLSNPKSIDLALSTTVSTGSGSTGETNSTSKNRALYLECIRTSLIASGLSIEREWNRYRSKQLLESIRHRYIKPSILNHDPRNYQYKVAIFG